MHIILISDRLAKSRPVTLSSRHLVAICAALLALTCSASAALFWLTLRYAGNLPNPVLEQAVRSASEAEAARRRVFVQQNVNAMAVKLGEMQAQLTRLDALGERLSSVAGFRPQDFRLAEAPGMGGGSVSLMPPQTLSLGEFSDKLATLRQDVDRRNDMLHVLEARIFEQAVRGKMVPNMRPVHTPYVASGFGRRIDPFTGELAMHEGLDFPAEKGTPVYAAAAGVIVVAAHQPDYGNNVAIDHGNGLLTRYAHLSKILVKEGEVVQRGREIGEVGSTGRSTGPHLHFEVRDHGVPENPAKFLRSNPYPALARAR